MKQEIIELLSTMGYTETRRFTNNHDETFVYFSKRVRKDYNFTRVFVFQNGNLVNRYIRGFEEFGTQKSLDVLQIEYNNLEIETELVFRMEKVAQIDDVASRV